MISAVLAITLLVGGLSICEVDFFVQRETENYIKVACEKETAQVNDIFGDMEKSVNIMSGYILDLADSAADIRSPYTQRGIIRNADRMFADVANHTDDAVAYYFRFAPEISDGKTGFFYSKNPGSSEYSYLEPTDISYYDKDDTERVGWFWQPYEAGKPVWMMPYYNRNNGIMMISYVVPLYSNNQFIGVVGMDFDYTVLDDKVRNIKIYDNGFAYLEMDGVPIGLDADVALSYEKDDYLQVSEELVNGMTLVLSASYRDIMHTRYEIAARLLCAGAILAVVFSVITVLMVRQIVKPLETLTEASKKLAEGDYNLELLDSDTYEIQLLSTAFENMAANLRQQQRQQFLLAYIDPLTGLRNATAYNVWVTDFEQEIQTKNRNFGIMMLDLNNLKEVNDAYGHDAGNKLIAASARIISEVFKGCPVYRIGGDEFVVILRNRQLQFQNELCRRLDLECARTYVESENQRIQVSIARGFARYNPATDDHFADVFTRADEAMYENKRAVKA